MIRNFTISDGSRLIRNGGSPSNQRARRLCVHAIQKALVAIDPSNCLTACLKLDHERIIIRNLSLSISDFSHINIIAVGKASVPMMDTALGLLNKTQRIRNLGRPEGGEDTSFR